MRKQHDLRVLCVRRGDLRVFGLLRLERLVVLAPVGFDILVGGPRRVLPIPLGLRDMFRYPLRFGREPGESGLEDSGQTLPGSFSAVSKPNFASKYSLESSRRDLQNALLCTVL